MAEAGLAERILVDFSVMSSFDYYTGIVFEAYAPQVGTPLGSGGRYDNMIGAYGTPRPAAGFAFFLEQALVAASVPSADGAVGTTPARRGAKGSLNPDAVEALGRQAWTWRGLDNPGRQLIVRRPGVEYIIVRPTDAPVFVALGAADCGICGKDSLLKPIPTWWSWWT